jgi:hypothetical protein
MRQDGTHWLSCRWNPSGTHARPRISERSVPLKTSP